MLSPVIFGLVFGIAGEATLRFALFCTSGIRFRATRSAGFQVYTSLHGSMQPRIEMIMNESREETARSRASIGEIN